ncbi:hypothetical protein IIC45_01170, partial [Patescibacteria group bacterium]|nr:hypothetical protein [Patescibacteria group bacterium]
VAVFAALAFYKLNNRQFINIVESVFKYILGNRRYIWKKEEKKIIKKKEIIEESTDVFVPKLSGSKLKDLAWSLDIQESIYSSKDQQK